MINEIEIKKLWQTANEKLEESLILNQDNLNEITKMKVHNFLGSMKPVKILTLTVGILWVGITGAIVINLFFSTIYSVNMFFLLSAAIQIGLTTTALYIYIYQLVTINQVDLSEPILKTQQKLTNLKASTLWVTRILFLQLPVWTTFHLNSSMLESGNELLWVFQGIVTLSFTFIAIWLFFNIKYENKDKKWFRLVFNGREWMPLMKAMKLMEEIEEYKS